MVADGIDTVHVKFSYALAPGLENLVLLGTGAINGGGNKNNNTLTGNGANNSLKGGAGDDILIGSNGKPNKNEVDILIGGTGRDTFVLGTVDTVFYNDRKLRTQGQSNYAIIQDFTPRQGDQIQLKGQKETTTLVHHPFHGSIAQQFSLKVTKKLLS